MSGKDGMSGGEYVQGKCPRPQKNTDQSNSRGGNTEPRKTKHKDVSHLHKTSCRSHFWLFEYDTLFERERCPLYNDTQIIILS